MPVARDSPPQTPATTRVSVLPTGAGPVQRRRFPVPTPCRPRSTCGPVPSCRSVAGRVRRPVGYDPVGGRLGAASARPAGGAWGPARRLVSGAPVAVGIGEFGDTR